MRAIPTRDLPTLYYRTEDHFFTVTCPLRRRYGACITAYFTDLFRNPSNLLLIRVGNAPSGDAMTEPLGLIRRTCLAIQVVIHEEKVEGVHEALTELGLQPAERTTTMALELSRRVPSVSERFAQISLTRNLNDWALPIGNAFAVPPEVVAHYQARHQRALDAGHSLHHFTLSVEERVACSLTLSLCDGVARLNDVGTIKEFRGQGHATQLINAALLHASNLGAQRCFLEASMAGRSLYSTLGFKPLFDYQYFNRGAVAGT
ncbi:GNAT family N-acetyltransferase [Pseudomonas sp. PB105]|nr:GNAT family N-acetyltransferase [Pseudomonas sp. PB100]KAE9650855.1 GNAT family N-acetyltransferase [Pseudomonas sp. PB105]MVW94741.1 GNAT family N-acetyltransferase [Pseudomonas sp. PB100]